MALLKSSDLGMTVDDYKKIHQTCSVATVAANVAIFDGAKLNKTKIKQQNTNENLCMLRTVLDLGGNNANNVLEKMKDSFEKDGKLLGTDPATKQQNFSSSNLPKKQQLDIYNSCFLGVNQLNEIDLTGDLSDMNVEQINEAFSKCLQDNGVIVKTSPEQPSYIETTPIPKLDLGDIKLATPPPPKKKGINTAFIGGTVGSSLLIFCICCICSILVLVLINFNS